MKSTISIYILFFILLIFSYILSVIGSFISLPYKHLTMWESIKMSIPIIWVVVIFSTYAIFLMHKYSLLTNAQMFFLGNALSFTLILLMNHFYIKQKINISDYVAIGILFIAFSVSEFHLFSKLFKLPIPEDTPPKKEEKKDPKTEKTDPKSQNKDLEKTHPNNKK